VSKFIVILAILSSSVAWGRSYNRRRPSPARLVLQPGECVDVGGTEVCAEPQRLLPAAPPPPPVVLQEAPRTPVQAVYACRLTERRTPNVWELVRVGGDNVRTTRVVVKTFAHFEGSSCEAEAERLGNQEGAR
jgi:hypothetical protein